MPFQVFGQELHHNFVSLPAHECSLMIVGLIYMTGDVHLPDEFKGLVILPVRIFRDRFLFRSSDFSSSFCLRSEM